MRKFFHFLDFVLMDDLLGPIFIMVLITIASVGPDVVFALIKRAFQ